MVDRYRKNSSHRLFQAVRCLSVGILLAVVLAKNATALDIVLTDVGTTPMTAAQLAAFQKAASQWEARFADPVTVNLNVAWEEASYFSRIGVLASTRSRMTEQSYFLTLQALELDRSASFDMEPLEYLFLFGSSPGDNPLWSYPLPVEDTNGTRSALRTAMSSAQAKALGMGTVADPLWGDPPSGGADGDIRFNKAVLSQWDLDPTDGIDSAKYDFVGTAAHEIGHALGFMSGTDAQDGYPSLVISPTPLDILRFEQDSGAFVFRDDDRPLKAKPAQFCVQEADFRCTFTNTSINGFSWGRGQIDPDCNGSGGTCQASHFSDATLYLMDPTFGLGERKDFSSWDTDILGVVGWDKAVFRLHVPPLFQDGRFEFLTIDSLPNGSAPLPGFPDPPPSPSGSPDESNIGFIASVDFGGGDKEAILGGKRTFTAIAQFKPEQGSDLQDYFAGIQISETEWEDFEPLRGPLKLLPPSLCNLEMISDDVNGPKLKGSLFSDCVAFEPDVGDFGGWRLPICLDGLEDNEEGDCDASAVIFFAMEEAVEELVLEKLVGQSAKIVPTDENSVRIGDPASVGMNDTDNDGVWDGQDNCSAVSNMDQRDSDGDGFGNICDADLNNSGEVVNFLDLAIFKSVFFTDEPDADFNGDGTVNFLDLARFKALFFQPPGPGAEF